MNMISLSQTPPARQQGSALAIGLIFLVIITMLGLTASSGAIHQELITRNIRDSYMALQAAEAAMRGAETWLRSQAPPEPNGVEVLPIDYCNPPSLGGTVNCAEQDEAWWQANAMEFGSLSGVDALTDITTPPRYVIELYRREPSITDDGQWTFYYRITARGTGISDSTVRMVRSIYRW